MSAFGGKAHNDPLPPLPPPLPLLFTAPNPAFNVSGGMEAWRDGGLGDDNDCLAMQIFVPDGVPVVGHAFDRLAVWFRPKVVRLEYLLDADDEEVVRRLRAKGHELHWVLETRLRESQRDGWKPVTQWDKTGQRSIFMDNREELFLLHSVRPARIRYDRLSPAPRIPSARLFACHARSHSRC
jgi:hypothetical protein